MEFTMKNKFTPLFLVGFALVVMGLLKMFPGNILKNDPDNSNPMNCMPRPSTVEWVSQARTIKELTIESDLIVRVLVSGTPFTQVFTSEVQVMDENGKPTHTTEIRMLYSDTVLEVIKALKGQAKPFLTVRQTGGFGEEFMDDPLYKLGEEYILFISSVDSGEIYRTVNPHGRYQIYDDKACSFGEFVNEDTYLPVNELEEKIIQTLNSK
jgi:hypothetical protein